MMRKTCCALKNALPAGPTAQKYTGPSYEQTLKARKTFVNPAIFTVYKEPFMIVEGQKQWVFDDKGERYLDLFGGIVTTSVGHSHPRIVKVIREQSEKCLHTCTLYLNPMMTQLCEDLAKKMPAGEEWVVYPTSSGSEANDIAMTAARCYTGNYDYIALRNGYHGGTEGTRSMIAVPRWKHPIPSAPGIKHAMCPQAYRGLLGTNVDAYVNELQELIIDTTPNKVAGFIAERYQGVGGSVPLLKGYLPKAYEVVRAAGGVCISDEVQCGFGRLGTHYWGFETEGVVPDMIVCAKSFGNGIPIGAVVMKRKIADHFAKALHFNTFGGNPLSSAVAIEVMKIIEDEKLQENCKVVGDRILAGFNKLAEKYEIIGDVRGAGLMLGVELVTNRTTKAPAVEATNAIFETLKSMKIIIGKGGTHGNVFRVKPPMCVTEADADYLIYAFEEAIKKL